MYSTDMLEIQLGIMPCNKLTCTIDWMIGQ